MGNMRLLWLCFVLHTAFAQAGFGRSYLRNSRLCHEWSCVNTKLGLSDFLPAREHYTVVLKSLLPSGAWQGVVETVLDACYGNKTRRYTNTCPGQALFHCVTDQLIENCPEENLRKEDACSPTSSIAGLKYMFSQSLYENLEKNLANERRPAWFLKNYFNSKCCRLPSIINKSLLSECGFSTMMQYHSHAPRYDNFISQTSTTNAPVTKNDGNSLEIVSLNNNEKLDPALDPLECCDMTEFIRPSWRSECDFKLSWEGQRRLSIGHQSRAPTTKVPTTTRKPVKPRDLVLLPHSCEKETCVFRNLNIVSESGAVDIDAFSKLLDNFTDSQPLWTKAKARVVTTCLRKSLKDYEAECEINKILACTFDVLTENCPFTKKTDLCKHTRENIMCQISSSKYRPKHRRDTCHIPDLVHRDVLTECGIISLSRVEQAAEIPTVIKHRKHSLFTSKYMCKDQTPSTTCIMSKMGVLNKYGFMDYFKMKDRIRQFTTTQLEWAALVDIYMSAFTNIPMYREHCSSPKKLLNVVDSMLMTCPITRRKNSPQCTHIFKEMTETAPIPSQNITKEKLDEILKHFHHVFMPYGHVTTPIDQVRPKPVRKVIKKPLYDFGLLNSRNAPPVQIINVKPKPQAKRPLILMPVYMRMPKIQNQILKPYHNYGVLRSSPFWLHNQIAKAHANATTQVISTTDINITVPVSTVAPTISTVITTDHQDIVLP